MQFRILGPLEISVDGRRLPLGRSRHQRLLALLLLDGNRVVPVDRIVAALWDDEPPRTARKLVQNSVSALRQQFVDADRATDPLVASPSGYTLRIADQQLDLRVFEHRVARARQLASNGEIAGAVEELRAGLALWRGPALSGLPGRLFEARSASLDETRLAALEQCLSHELALGRHREVVAELAAVAAEHPLRERLVGQLMLALHRSDRQADALAVFQQLRTRLAEELGLDPAAELCRLQQAILRGDGNLAVSTPPAARAAPPAARPGPPSEVPAQLPADPADFTGRTEYLRQLDALLPGPGADKASAAVVIAVGGTAGVGKTSLAVHWGHRVAHRFPDGQLYIDLRGYAVGPRLRPVEALARFLRSLGVEPDRIPTEPEEAAALYRSRLADKRVLVVLDNAGSPDQVRPLLPGSPGCVAVVTSRNHLTGLIATEGARPVELELLTRAEARALLKRRLGEERLRAEPAAVADLIARCARLPLALAVVAARAATRPRFPLSRFADELNEVRGRLDALDGDDAATNVRAVLSWSYQSLSAEAARLFRLLALPPGPDIATPAAASLAGLPLPTVRSLLAELDRARLVAEPVPGRFTCHDLLRAYAAERARTEDPEPDRRTALERVLNHYLHTAWGADRLLSPARIPIDPPPVAPLVTPERLADPAAAAAWFVAEHTALLEAVRQCADNRFDTYAWQLPWTLANRFFNTGRGQEWAETQEIALAAAGRLDDRTALANAHRGLGRAYGWLRRFEDAHRNLRLALALFEELADVASQAHTHIGISWLFDQQRRHREALSHDQRAVELYDVAGDGAGAARALAAVAWDLGQLGDHERSITYCQQALRRYEQLGDAYGVACAWNSLGYAHHHLGRYPEAIGYYEKARTLSMNNGDQYTEAHSLWHLGDSQHALGRSQAARNNWLIALHILDQLGHADADLVRAKLAPPTVSAARDG